MASIWDYLSNVPDVAKSFGTGLMNGGAELVGTPGDLRSGMQAATNPLFDRIDAMTGYHPPQAEPRFNILPTSDQIKSNLTAYQHIPQTEGGQYARLMGDMLPTFLGGFGLLNKGQSHRGRLAACRPSTAR